MTPKPDFVPSGTGHTHDTVLLEWTAKEPAAATYDGGAPRELLRAAHPFPNHNGGQIAFNPLARPGSADFGLLYVGIADGGSGGDPYKLGQNLDSAFAKILRIDPLGKNSANGKYGIPPSIRLPPTARTTRLARSTPTACATRSASRGTRRPATCSWPTSARTSSRRSAR